MPVVCRILPVKCLEHFKRRTHCTFLRISLHIDTPVVYEKKSRDEVKGLRCRSARSSRLPGPVHNKYRISYHYDDPSERSVTRDQEILCDCSDCQPFTTTRGQTARFVTSQMDAPPKDRSNLDALSHSEDPGVSKARDFMSHVLQLKHDDTT